MAHWGPKLQSWALESYITGAGAEHNRRGCRKCCIKVWRLRLCFPPWLWMLPTQSAGVPRHRVPPTQILLTQQRQPPRRCHVQSSKHQGHGRNEWQRDRRGCQRGRAQVWAVKCLFGCINNRRPEEILKDSPLLTLPLPDIARSGQAFRLTICRSKRPGATFAKHKSQTTSHSSCGVFQH